MKAAFALIAITSIPLSACATTQPFEGRAVVRTTTIDRPIDQSWDRVIELFARQQIRVDTIDRDSGVITGTRTYPQGRPAEAAMLVRCGLHPPQPSAITVNVSMFLSESADGGTTLTVNPAFTERFRDVLTGQPVERTCASTGVFEAQAHNYVRHSD